MKSVLLLSLLFLIGVPIFAENKTEDEAEVIFLHVGFGSEINSTKSA